MASRDRRILRFNSLHSQISQNPWKFKSDKSLKKAFDKFLKIIKTNLNKILKKSISKKLKILKIWNFSTSWNSDQVKGKKKFHLYNFSSTFANKLLFASKITEVPLWSFGTWEYSSLFYNQLIFIKRQNSSVSSHPQDLFYFFIFSPNNFSMRKMFFQKLSATMITKICFSKNGKKSSRESATTRKTGSINVCYWSL